MKSKRVIIVPYAGLCNRIRVIASGIYIAKRIKSKAIIIWILENGLNAKFSDLFLPIGINDVIIKEKNIYYSKFYTLINKYAFLRKILSFFYNQSFFNFNKNTDGCIFQFLDFTAKRMFLSSCHSMSDLYDLNLLFRPQRTIQNQIDIIVRSFKQNTIGIHIRRTDNIQSKTYSSLNKFIELIENEISLDNNVRFFLATDDSDVKLFLKNKYGNFIILNQCDLNRDSVEGMKAAVIDLFCLSKTKCIWGSYGSSYSEIAAILGKIELKVV